MNGRSEGLTNRADELAAAVHDADAKDPQLLAARDLARRLGDEHPVPPGRDLLAEDRLEFDEPLRRDLGRKPMGFPLSIVLGDTERNELSTVLNRPRPMGEGVTGQTEGQDLSEDAVVGLLSRGAARRGRIGLGRLGTPPRFLRMPCALEAAASYAARKPRIEAMLDWRCLGAPSACPNDPHPVTQERLASQDQIGSR